MKKKYEQQILQDNFDKRIWPEIEKLLPSDISEEEYSRIYNKAFEDYFHSKSSFAPVTDELVRS